MPSNRIVSTIYGIMAIWLMLTFYKGSSICFPESMLDNVSMRYDLFFYIKKPMCKIPWSYCLLKFDVSKTGKWKEVAGPTCFGFAIQHCILSRFSV